jgi:hypothetical protein
MVAGAGFEPGVSQNESKVPWFATDYFTKYNVLT